MKKILVTPKSFLQSKEKAYAILRQYDAEVVENTSGKTLSEEQMLQYCVDIDGMIVGIDPVSEKVLRNAPKLKAISKYGAGLDNIDMKTAGELGIKVARAAGTNAVSVAELAVGMFFVLSRSIVNTAVNVKKGAWSRAAGKEILGKTVGIIGLGAIGREVARMSLGLGMMILAYDPYVGGDEVLDKYSVESVSLQEVFERSDFISLHLPLTTDTQYIVNKNTLGRMKKTAFLVNTSRGELVDEEELYFSLKEGAIAGAAQDVFSKEPPGEHKLLALDNFILTPHIGAYTTEATERMAVASAGNLARMLFEEDENGKQCHELF